MGLLVTFFLVSIIFSFLCSILEAVLLSITPAYVGIQENKKTAIAEDLTRFKADIDQPLAAILTLNTIAHTVGAIGVGSQAAVIFSETDINAMGLSSTNWEALIAGGMTLSILILSEVIPKTLGANNWELLTPFTVRALRIMLFILRPFVWLSQFITNNLKKDKDKPVLSRSDFAVMAEIGKETGVLEEKEQKIIYNLLRFSGVLVKDIMTPRIVVVSADEAISIREFHEKHEDLSFSRIPIYRENSDNITGYVLKDELLFNLVEENDNKPLKHIRRDVVVVHKTLAIPDLLDIFINKQEHMALVVDEFGGMEGIVTMEDIIETLLGIEIVDESDNTEDMQALARKNWEKRAKRMGIIPEEQESTEE
ncbi:MAG: hemolysin family protein [Pseudomonadota bacterium]|jgi:CBS domain containing-hemolysin-like protein|nr:hemolysin family protein [Pseudomonadales bacterium]MEC7767301.1 hemolysin family protein [Pseudomonadota bacterium]HAI15036.1 hemolysin [Gammaproteobacteria bacterium]MEC8995116.1 hemolysin family protein [Pseudomonadota bacterium]MED5385202.1 hemolysin family protein [Pseudomonadota bacterium]|tara:strand:- start:650 stop:1750 length:1101 start_codon:yes stop_codon:yes gene_type:complete